MSAPWWRDAVIYQVYPRSFADSNGDGVGDLGGVIQHLDHLADLGIDALWLSPVYRSPQADNGYDISDYDDVDPLFGTSSQLDELIASAHARGIRIIMDIVVNHTSDEHPWFVAARSSRTDPKRDWYWWRDPRDGAEPTNWASFFGGSAWTLDPGTGQYYLHLFDRKQPDLNWENPEVRAAVAALMRRWLERGVDGFRMDVINFVSKVPGLPDVPGVAPGGTGFAGASFMNGPRIHEFLHELRQAVQAGRDEPVLIVGEMPGVTMDEAVLYTDPARAEVDMVFQFDHVAVDHGEDKWDAIDLDLGELRRGLYDWQRALDRTGWNSLYWSNHDQPRAVSRFGDDHPDWWRRSATALATVLHGMRGTPFVYQGEEIGMTDFPWTAPHELRDVESINQLSLFASAGLSADQALDRVRHSARDNARTPMQWAPHPAGGFTDGSPWIAVNPNVDWISVERQRDDPESVLAHYRRLIELRHRLPVLSQGDFAEIPSDDPAVWAYARTLGDSRLVVIANLGREPRVLELEPRWAGGELLLANGPARAERLGRLVELDGWDARLYLRRGGTFAS